MNRLKYYNGIIKIAALIVLLPILLGKCTFSKTFQLYKDYRQIQSLEKTLVRAASSGNSITTSMPVNNENLISNGRLVELITTVCENNNVSIIQYEPLLLDREGDYKLYSANMVLSGNYVDLIKTLQFREEKIQQIKISSIQFEYDEKKMKDKKVEMRLYFRQIEK